MAAQEINTTDAEVLKAYNVGITNGLQTTNCTLRQHTLASSGRTALNLG